MMGTGTILEGMGNFWTMLEKKRIRFIPIFCLGTLIACQVEPDEMTQVSPPSVPTQIVAPADAGRFTSANSRAYQEAINLASSAFTLGQQATSPDDWDLIVSRWEQAIQTLKEVPTGDQNYGTAQTKIKDYERNLAQAKQRLVTLQQPPAEIVRPSKPALTPQAPVAAAVSNRVPIIERRGGTPVIEVMVNGRRYPMILDTGASHTHITRAMADELGVEVIGQASVATASSSRAVVDVAYVNSIQVGNITRSNLPVSIGDAVPIGLLGNDVYKNFDVTLQANSIEFLPR